LSGAHGQSFPPEFDLSPPTLRFDLLAKAQGVDAVRIETPQAIESALDIALQDDRPFLIDLVINGEV
jgi:benzoylformate decarboxylase